MPVLPARAITESQHDKGSRTMTTDTAALEAALQSIDGMEIAQLGATMGSIPSPTGREQAMGDFLCQWLADQGFQPERHEVADGRCNVVARLKGTGGGKSLIFNSHMDTILYGDEDVWLVPREEYHYNHGWVEDGKAFGEGVVNDKGPMAAFMLGTRALRDAGVKLRGDVIMTMVVGEIGMAPIDEYQGSRYLGKGIGAQQLIDHGLWGDYCLNAETTSFGISWADCGAAYYKVTLAGGRRLYTPFIRRPYSPQEQPNAIMRMAYFISAVEEWALKYEESHTREFEGGKIIPKVNIGAVRGGVPFKPASTVGVCSAYVDVRIPPGDGPEEAQRELERLLESLGYPGTVECYMFRRGHIGENMGPFREVLEKAHDHVIGGKPAFASSPVSSMWRDINIFNGAGIPSITYGPGSGPSEISYLSIDELHRAAQAYAATAYYACV